MKLVRCRDHGFDCTFEAKGSEEEVLQQVAAHAEQVHNLEITPELVEQVKGSMHNIEEEEK